MKTYTQVFQGTAFTSKSPKEIHLLKDHLFCINENGMIVKVVSSEEADYQPLLDAYQEEENFHRLAEGQYFLPGFVDLHVH
ncbi:guanine deaminase, partial [Neobacillus drentensis]